MRRPNLLINSAIYVLGQFVSRALGFLLLIVYARFLQPEDFGVTGTLSAYGAVLSTLLTLGLNGSVSRHYFEFKREPDALRSYLTTVFTFQAAVSGLAVGAVSLLGASLWRRWTSDAIPFHPHVQLMLWSTFFTTLALIPQTVYQTEERAATVVGWQLGQGAIAIAAAVLFVAVLRQRALGVLRSQALSSAVLALVFVVLFARTRASRHLRWAHLSRAIRFGLPLLPHVIGTVLMQSVDRMMLERYAPLSEVGLYSLAMTLGTVLAMLAGGINQAWAPHFLRTSKEEPPALARSKAEAFAALFVALFAALSLAGGLFAPELMRLFLGARYLPAVPYLLPFVIGNLIAVYYYLPANQLFLVEKTGWFMTATGAATMLSVGLNLWFLPRGGGAAAASWIFVAGNACQAGIVLLAARRYQRSLLGARHGAVLVASIAALGGMLARPGLPVRVLGAVALIAGVAWLLVRDNWRAAIPARAS